MNVRDFDYHLPRELIAQKPLPERDRSRLMVIDRPHTRIGHAVFHDLPALLRHGDVLVANDTRVSPVRLFGEKDTGGWVELLLLNFIESQADGSRHWQCLLKSRRKITTGTQIHFDNDLSATVVCRNDKDTWRVAMHCDTVLEAVLEKKGRTPLPHYIKRDRDGREDPLDRTSYQTVYALHQGAVAAPTAGLHFTKKLMQTLRTQGVDFVFITLHVGYGTFQTIREATVERHRMHTEYCRISEQACQSINEAKRRGSRIIAVGTTAARTLETMAAPTGIVTSGERFTDLFIYPGYSFKCIDALITNFHLPKSSLLMLVAAFAGTDAVMRAYREAVSKKYRFFSYGDAMMIT